MSEKDITAPESAPDENGTDIASSAVTPPAESAEAAPAETEAAESSTSEPEFIVDPFDPFSIPEEVESLIVEKIAAEVKERPSRRRQEPAQDSEDHEESVSRRRRRRRRGDEDIDLIGGDDEDPPNTITRVRAPRKVSEGTGADQVTAVKGSTRLEAKRQRRRDSRDSGRRRTVITEAEFLARRESVERKMVVREKDDRIQIGVLEDGVLAEHFVSNTQQDSLIGNVYVGKVQNVLPSMEAAFVDIGRGRNAVLYAGEINWESVHLDGKARRIENALKGGDTVLVQVSKDPVGHKGARLTSQISLPGRYLVYVPGGSMTGISRKLPDVERARLKKILKDHLPADAGVIVRTAAEGASEEELTNDINRLRVQWEGIKEKASSSKTLAPELLYAEPDLTIKVVRDVFNEDFSKLIVSGENTWDQIEAYVTYVAPDLVSRLERWESDEDIFSHFRIDEQIHKALDRKVFLPSGGSLVIDRTEAMTVVDVNTGKFTGSGGNLEETVTKNNLEAAEEVVRQLRLRDIGGIIVIDFIDMVLESNRDLVLRRLVECLGRDRTKHQVAEVTSLGLVQMTRKRMGTGLLEVFGELCPECAGRGMVTHEEPIIHRRPLAPTPAASKSEGRGPRAERRRRKPRHGDSETQGVHESGHDDSGADHAVEEHDEHLEIHERALADDLVHEDRRAAAEQAAEAGEKAAELEERNPEAEAAPRSSARNDRSERTDRSDRGDRSEHGGRRDRSSGRSSERGHDRSSKDRGSNERSSNDRGGRSNGSGSGNSGGNSGGGRGGRGQRFNPAHVVLGNGTRLAPGSLASGTVPGNVAKSTEHGPAQSRSNDSSRKSDGRRGGEDRPSRRSAPQKTEQRNAEPSVPLLDFGDGKVELPRGSREHVKPEASLEVLEQVFSSKGSPAPAERESAPKSAAAQAPKTTAPAAAPKAAPARRTRRVAMSAQGGSEVKVAERPVDAAPAQTFVASAPKGAPKASSSASAPVMLGVGVSAEEIARASKQ
jgi:ribonuclease E